MDNFQKRNIFTFGYTVYILMFLKNPFFFYILYEAHFSVLQIAELT
jgi:hypothetical protein